VTQAAGTEDHGELAARDQEATLLQDRAKSVQSHCAGLGTAMATSLAL
jgi:hypothetical protein